MTRALEEALLQHFIHQKLEIAYAINKPFPFFEGLRDNFFITERQYRESLEASRNLIPLPRVVYNILTQLETTFSLSFLEMLFSRINLSEYPKLMTTFKSFKKVVISKGGWSGIVTTPLEAPANPAGRSSLRALLQLPPCQHPPPRHPPSVSEPGAAAQRSAEILNEQPSLAGLTVALPEIIQEGRLTPVSSDNLIFQIEDEEDTQEMPCAPSAPVPVIREDAPEPSDPKELQEASRTLPSKKGKKRKRNIWATSKRRHQKKRLPRGAALPGHGIQKTLQVVDQVTHREDDSTRNTKVMRRAQKGSMECAQAPAPEEISVDTSEMDEGKRPQEPPPRITHDKDSTEEGSKLSVDKSPREKQRKRKIHSWSSSKKRQKKSLPREKPEDEALDFHSPKLPVTCGKAKGILYKEKMKQGSSVKCIQNEKGLWFTPREFEIEGQRTQSKNWKRTVRCRGKTLEQLLKKGLLLCPPRKSLKREPENSKECEVCCRGGPLLCCGTCPRAFHEDCHIPPAEAERSPWSCTFCRMKESSGSWQCRRESGVLARQMQPEEQLRCEFLLLKAYCHPQSSFFAETPHNIRDYGEPFREAMWLDLVKERLTEKVYTVAWFLRDMRLIFHNHKTFYKASDFGQVGLDLEAEFEKDLKEVLIFHEANENSFQAPP
ncbi:sp110 nuclear body protein isoform X2 [Hippopotamus amphibius kiboko]|uniref:sp110 nuclear body protein isoform X2 n=1 Tax=Hippopotamus amphibius kiboko TaxID=575201 RepID=UPI0025923EB8|nr:sp110 nuclear body protein isoform X2 [Hippopotamus amphibius kiboko]